MNKKHFSKKNVIIALLLITNIFTIYWHVTNLKPIEIKVTTPNPENFTLLPAFTKGFIYRPINITVEEEVKPEVTLPKIEFPKYVEIVNSIDGEKISCKEDKIEAVNSAINTVTSILEDAQNMDSEWSSCVQTCKNNGTNTVVDVCEDEDCANTVADIAVSCIDSCSQDRSMRWDFDSDKNTKAIENAYAILAKYCRL